jgi:ABC-type glycerol-3-phosphate transport system permease component
VTGSIAPIPGKLEVPADFDALRDPRRWLTPSRLFYLIVALAGLAFFLLPIYWMAITAVKPESDVLSIPPSFWPSHFDFGSLRTVLTSSTLLTALKNSVILTFIPVVGDTLSAAVVAYAFARLRAPGSGVLFALMLATLMIPFQVTLIPQFILFNYLGWIDTFLPLIVPTFFGTAFNVFLLRQFFRQIPRELDEAATLDGLGHFGIFRRIILPMSKPALVAVATFSFVYHWNDFLYPLVYLNSPGKYPLPYAINQYALGAYGFAEYNHLFALGLFSTLPCLILFFLAQRYFVSGIVVAGQMDAM